MARDPGMDGQGGTKTGNGNRVEIHGVDVQLVGVEQQEADYFALADLRIRCGRMSPKREGNAFRILLSARTRGSGYSRPARPTRPSASGVKCSGLVGEMLWHGACAGRGGVGQRSRLRGEAQDQVRRITPAAGTLRTRVRVPSTATLAWFDVGQGERAERSFLTSHVGSPDRVLICIERCVVDSGQEG